MTTTTHTFEVGATYQGRFICDADSIFTRTVTKRTAKSVWLMDSRGEVKRYMPRVSYGAEYIALGNYSMAPGLHADKRVG